MRASKKYFIYRLLFPFIVGIIIGYYYSIQPILYGGIIVASSLLLLLFWVLPTFMQFSYYTIKSIALYSLIFLAGLLVVDRKNVYSNNTVASKYYTPNTAVWLELSEDVVAKANSYKTEANIIKVKVNNAWVKTTGKVIIYFKKDSTTHIPQLGYKQQIITHQLLQPLQNAGNPGGFNYKQYSAFNGIIYQTYIPANNYIVLHNRSISFEQQIIYNLQKNILLTLRTYITSTAALAIAEALLIGYREDLDRDTVQAYSNTGVVHIIAISGMHIAMVYGLLVFIFSFFKQTIFIQFLQLGVVIVVLWLFTAIAGGAPSILRSAIMFTCIVIGNTFKKQVSIYHTIGLSAFIILVIQPFSLWNVGFQLSYAAVLSIVIFNTWVKNWFYISNKVLKYIWGLCAITIAAQVFTLPLVLYHFHQFPVLFLVTNLLAVPLSGIVLYACIALLFFSWWPLLAKGIGIVITVLLTLLNYFIVLSNKIPFAVWPNIQLSIVQSAILFVILIAFTIWVLYKNATAFVIGVYAFLLLLVCRTVDFVKRNKQHQLIVYNVPKHTAIDIIEGRNYYFIGDSILLADGFLRNFHIKPARILYRTTYTNTLMHTQYQPPLIQTTTKKIVIINKPLPTYYKPTNKINVDIIILTNNPTIYLQQLTAIFNCKQLVVDANNPAWKVRYWKKDALALGLPMHYVVEQGAYITAL